MEPNVTSTGSHPLIPSQAAPPTDDPMRRATTQPFHANSTLNRPLGNNHKDIEVKGMAGSPQDADSHPSDVGAGERHSLVEAQRSGLGNKVAAPDNREQAGWAQQQQAEAPTHLRKPMQLDTAACRRIIDISADTQNSAASQQILQESTTAKNIAMATPGLMPPTRPKGRPQARQSSTIADKPLDNFIHRLKEQVITHDLAQIYGLDKWNLEASAKEETTDAEGRAAQADLKVLKGIATYLERQREHTARWSGSEFMVTLGKIPSRILTIEQRRFEELQRPNRCCSHLYTDFRQGAIYRCPLPGCGGATINQRSIKRALVTHHKAYHKELQNIQFVFKIEMTKGWDYLTIPPRQNNASISGDTGSTQGRSDGGGRLSQETSPRENTANKPAEEISTLRQALLGKVAIGNDVTRFRCHREKTAVPPDQTGVYNVCRGQWGARKVTGQGHIFRRGANLQTVEKNTSLSDAPLTQIATEGLPQCAVRLRTNMPQGGYTGTLGDGVELDEFHRSLLTSVQRDAKQKQTNRFANPKVL